MSGPLNHSPAEIIKQLLIDLNLVEETLGQDWCCYINSQPDSPDNLFVISDTTPVTDGRIQFTGRTIEHSGISILVRGFHPKVTWKKLHTIQLNGIDTVHRKEVTITDEVGTGTDSSTYLIHAMDLLSGILSLGKEPTTGNRFLFSLNALATITLLSATGD